VAVEWSGDVSAEIIGRTITESLMHALSSFRDLRVVGPSTPGSDDPREIGPEFDVRFVLQGSVIARGSQVRLSARLSDSRSGWTVWSSADTVETSSFVAFEVEDRWAREVAARIADATGAMHRYEISEPSTDPATRGQTAKLAYYAFLENASWRTTATAALALDRAIEGGDRSLDVLAMRAWVYTSDVIHGTSAQPEHDLRAAERLAREVLAADPRRAEAQIALGDIAALRKQYTLATRCAAQAVDLAPYHPTVLMAAGTIHCICGDWARGEGLMRESFRLSPEQPDSLHALPALARLLAEDFHGALLEADLIHSSDQPWGPLYRALALAGLGELRLASAEMDTVLALDPHVLDDPLSHFRESRVCLTADQLDLLSRYFDPFLETGSRRGALDV
jgi:TolB-like protein/Flp pilus assembly protein TadD